MDLIIEVNDFHHECLVEWEQFLGTAEEDRCYLIKKANLEVKSYLERNRSFSSVVEYSLYDFIKKIFLSKRILFNTCESPLPFILLSFCLILRKDIYILCHNQDLFLEMYKSQSESSRKKKYFGFMMAAILKLKPEINLVFLGKGLYEELVEDSIFEKKIYIENGGLYKYSEWLRSQRKINGKDCYLAIEAVNIFTEEPINISSYELVVGVLGGVNVLKRDYSSLIRNMGVTHPEKNVLILNIGRTILSTDIKGEDFFYRDKYCNVDFGIFLSRLTDEDFYYYIDQCDFIAVNLLGGIYGPHKISAAAWMSSALSKPVIEWL